MGLKLGYHRGDLPVTEEYAQRVLRLPFHNYLGNKDLARITTSIGKFYNEVK